MAPNASIPQAISSGVPINEAEMATLVVYMIRKIRRITGFFRHVNFHVYRSSHVYPTMKRAIPVSIPRYWLFDAKLPSIKLGAALTEQISNHLPKVRGRLGRFSAGWGSCGTASTRNSSKRGDAELGITSALGFDGS